MNVVLKHSDMYEQTDHRALLETFVHLDLAVRRSSSVCRNSSPEGGRGGQVNNNINPAAGFDAGESY